jgi:endonuclease YncB( thermonuclease family)
MTSQLFVIGPGYTYSAIITAVHDGDTVTCSIDLGMRTWLHDQKIRFAGINAPELATPEGVASLNALTAMLGGSIPVVAVPVIIQTHKDRTEKWGRWLGTIWKTQGDGSQINVNQAMLAGGWAVKM